MSATSHTRAWLEQHPPSAKVRRLVDAGRHDAAAELYNIELAAAALGISPQTFKRTYAGVIEEDRRKRGEAVVYFIGRSAKPADGEPIKIGIARNVAARMRSLQTGSPDDLYLLGTMEGGKQRESEIHQRFHEHHIRGEWFRMCEAIRSYLRAKRRNPELDL